MFGRWEGDEGRGEGIVGGVDGHLSWPGEGEEHGVVGIVTVSV
jgi:hypothetical protein